MKKVTFWLVFLVCSFAYAQIDSIQKYADSNRNYYIKKDKLYSCGKFGKTNDNKLDASKCLDEIEYSKESKEYEFLYPLLKKNIKSPLDYHQNYAYHLPFEKGQTYKISQGYDGSFSHLNKNAIDFEMPDGSPVYAARDGIVVATEDKNSQGCPTEDCTKYNNYIQIHHPDFTMANYLHFKKNGVLIKEGDHVKKGQLIGYSGNTGWSSGPHLHFECYYYFQDKKQIIKTLFRTGDGTKMEYLYEGQSYTKRYD